MIKREIYLVQESKLVRQRRFCPRCGPGIFLAEHKDRFTCGKCGYTEFKKEGKFKEEKHTKEHKPAVAPHAEATPKVEAPKEEKTKEDKPKVEKPKESKPKAGAKKAETAEEKPKEPAAKGKSKKPAKEE